jgi:23S rRNA (guanosine2251-2'-O)-methyltransferase
MHIQKPGTENLKPVFVILDNVRSSENVGSIFRTADAAGVSKIYLCGYTPAPFDRFKRKNTKLSKAALGAEDTVAWEHAQDIRELIERLKAADTTVIGVEQSPASIPYTELKPFGSVAYVFGNEVDGVSENVLKLCDEIVEIPMSGAKESLNVSVSVGIILFSSRPGF